MVTSRSVLLRMRNVFDKRCKKTHTQFTFSNYFSKIVLKQRGPSHFQTDTLQADSHVACRAAKGLECVFPILFTQCGRV